MNRSIWVFGILAGLIPGVFMYFLFRDAWYLQAERQVRFTLGGYAVLALCIIFALVFWKKINNGISLGRSMVTGLAVASLRGIVLIFVFSGIFLNHPEWMNQPRELAVSQYVEKMDSVDRTPENEQKVIKAINNQFTPWGYAKSALFESLIIGVVVSVLTAGFIARSNFNRNYKD